MWYKTLSPSKNTYGLVNPFGVDHGVETLKVAPSHLLILHIVDIVSEIEANYVAVSKFLFEGHDYGCLSQFLWEVVRN